MSCLRCKRVQKCTHVREVALSAFLKLPVISDAITLFEITSSRCPDFGNKKRRVVKGQLDLFGEV